MSTIVRRVIARTAAGNAREPGMIRLKRLNSSGPGVAEDVLSPHGQTPSSIVAGTERADALRAAIAALPEDYRQVLTRYRLEERSLEEVAREMGRTKGATSRLLARAVEALQASFDDHGQFFSG